MKKILITGGTGLVGTLLNQLLTSKGYEVGILTRSETVGLPFKSYRWSIDKWYIEDEAFENANVIIHLAGANVADKRWTDQRKKHIISSRVESIKLLHEYLQKGNHQVDTFIGASAIGYYGNRGNELLTEESSYSDGFLSEVCQVWEAAYAPIRQMDIRQVVLRIGIVLSKEGGALPLTALPVKFHLGSYFGDGQQYYSWIHIQDLCNMIIAAIEQKQVEGVYNAVAPNPTKHKEFVATIANALGKKALMAPIPTFMARLGMGEMADIVLNSVRVSSQKMEETGFVFQYPELLGALQAIYR